MDVRTMGTSLYCPYPCKILQVTSSNLGTSSSANDALSLITLFMQSEVQIMRKPMVTRNFKITRANVLFLDTKSGITYQQEVVIPRTYQSTEKMLKAVSKAYDNEATKALHIMSSTTDELLYGMSEQDFINGATLLDPETRKPIPENKPVFVDEGYEADE